MAAYDGAKVSFPNDCLMTVSACDASTASSIALLARDGASLRLTFAANGTLVIFR